jgi:hypothetical protein
MSRAHAAVVHRTSLVRYAASLFLLSSRLVCFLDTSAACFSVLRRSATSRPGPRYSLLALTTIAAHAICSVIGAIVMSTTNDTSRRVASGHCQDVINSYNLTDLEPCSACAEDLCVDEVLVVQGHYVTVVAAPSLVVHQCWKDSARITIFTPENRSGSAT